jgi:hypothetical protein
MEVRMALGVPKLAPLLTVTTLVNLASATPVGVRLVAVGAVIAESSVVGAVLPADGANSRVAFLAVGVAQSAIFLLILGAG